MTNSIEGLGTLADATQHCAPIELPADDRSWLGEALRRMLLIRCAEERIGDMVAAGKIRCPCHLAIGQEAAAVGVARALRKTDRSFGAHRSHAHFLALGGSVHSLLAEVLGKVTGASRGMGGSMHLIDRPHGLFGTVPIVGATIPIATGAALAAKMDGNGDVAVSFFGDGATEEGVFHESMNMASAMKLPVLFVCENNLFSSHLHISLRQPGDSVSRYAIAHRVPGWLVDGNDVVAVARAATAAVSSMRINPGPAFIEAVTYRWRGHVGPRDDDDVGVSRKDDLVAWRQRDPVRRLYEALVASGEEEPGILEDLRSDARRAVDEAWEQALRDPFPPSTATMNCVYSEASR